VKQALEEAGLTQERVRALWAAASPCYYYDKIAGAQSAGPKKRVLLVYADYDLTFPREYSLRVVDAFGRIGLNFEPRVLPCGHYTTANAVQVHRRLVPGWFVYRAFKALRREKAAGLRAARLRRMRWKNRPSRDRNADRVLQMAHNPTGLNPR